MKKFLFSLTVILCWAITALAQNPFINIGKADSSIKLPAIRQSTAVWASAHASLPGTGPAVSRRIDTANHDTAYAIVVKLRFSQIWDVVNNLTVAPEGMAATPNKELLDALRGILPQHPALATALGIILAHNDASYQELVGRELARLAGISDDVDSNDDE